MQKLCQALRRLKEINFNMHLLNICRSLHYPKITEKIRIYSQGLCNHQLKWKYFYFMKN